MVTPLLVMTRWRIGMLWLTVIYAARAPRGVRRGWGGSMWWWMRDTGSNRTTGSFYTCSPETKSSSKWSWTKQMHAEQTNWQKGKRNTKTRQDKPSFLPSFLPLLVKWIHLIDLSFCVYFFLCVLCCTYRWWHVNEEISRLPHAVHRIHMCSSRTGAGVHEITKELYHLCTHISTSTSTSTPATTSTSTTQPNK